MLTAIIGLAATFLTPFIAKLGMKASKFLDAKVKNELLSGILTRLNDAIFTAVAELQQTVVEDLKSKAADGKLSSKDAQFIKSRALASIKNYLGEHGAAEAMKILGLEENDFAQLLADKVEAELQRQKRADDFKATFYEKYKHGLPK